jgi:polyisoprenoid-binding protein YceI
VLDSLRTRIGFDADATMGAFGGTARRFRGHAALEDTASLAGATGRVEIDVSSFRTGIGMRDGHLRGDLDADEHPTITFVLAGARRAAEPFPPETGLQPAAGEAARAPVLLNGQLTIRGETRDIGIPALVRFTADSLYARGRVPVRFTDFAMKPPSRLFGMAKVDDALVLHFDAVFGIVR